MLEQYIPVLVQLIFAAGLAGGLLLITHLFGPRIIDPVKLSPFECGVDLIESARHRFSVKFYVVAMLFILFDIEAVFFYPWAVTFKSFLGNGLVIMWEMLTFVGVLLAGFVYILKKGVLEWA